jgi:hypothetical protein
MENEKKDNSCNDNNNSTKTYLIRRDVKLTDAGSLIMKNKVVKFSETIIHYTNRQPASEKRATTLPKNNPAGR